MARRILPRLEFLILKDKSPTDAAQVPAGATIHFYRQGATVKLAATIPVTLNEPDPQPTAVTVYDAGRLDPNDAVRVGTGSASLVVSWVNSATEILLMNQSASEVMLGSGVRLVPTNNRPLVYSDPFGKVSLGTSILTDSNSGRATAFMSRSRVDYDVVISGQATRLYVDAGGQYGRSDQRWNDVRDFGRDLQAAIDALPPDGGVVFVPAGETILTMPVVIQKPNVTILGEQQGSVIRPESINAFDLITVENRNFQLRDLTIDGRAYPGYPNGTKSCVVVRGPAFSGNSVAGLGLRNVVIEAAPRYGLWLRDAGQFYAKNCHFVFNVDSGLRIEGVPEATRDIHFEACGSSQNGNRGLDASDVTGLLLLACVFEGNKNGSGEFEGTGVEALNCRRIELRSCYFEDAHTSPRAHQFVMLEQCPLAVVDGGWFTGGTSPAQEPYRPKRAVRFSNSPGCRFSNCGTEAMTEASALFDASSPDGLEMGTRDFEAVAGISRLDVQTDRLYGMSRRALGMPIHVLGAESLPAATAVRAGSMVCQKNPISGKAFLLVSDGSTWKTVLHE